MILLPCRRRFGIRGEARCWFTPHLFSDPEGMKAVMYHYVRAEDPDYPFFRYLHVDDFCKQLDYFQATYGLVSRTEFLASFRTGKPAPGIVLTFDDGFREHFTTVFAELKRRHLWAVFYVCSGIYTQRKLLDVHKVHLLLGKFGGETVYTELCKRITSPDLLYKRFPRFRRNTYRNQKNDFFTTEVKRILNFYLGDGARSEILKSLFSELIGNEEAWKKIFYLSVEEIVEMHNAGMLIGSHSIDHPVMSKLGIKAQEKQIEESFGWLQTVLPSADCRTFCYPYGGAHSYNRNTESLLKKHKVRFSFSVEPRDVTANDLAQMMQALPRYDCNAFPFGQARDIAPNVQSGNSGLAGKADPLQKRWK